MISVELKDLITIEDVSDILGISKVTISRYRKERGLESVVIEIPSRDRPAIRYSLKGLLKWAKENEVKKPGYKEWKRKYRT